MNFFNIAYDKDFSLQFEFDHTGFSTYSEADKEKIINESFEKLFTNNGVYTVAGEIPDQKMMTKPSNSMVSDVCVNPTEEVVKKIKKAIIYNLYMFGTFKWGKFIVIDIVDITVPLDNNETTSVKGFRFFDTGALEQTSGVLQSAYSSMIIEFAEKLVGKQDNNLYKVVKNHGYELKDEQQKKYMFGKAHIALKGTDKIKLRQDINLLFNFMSKSKDAVQREGRFEKIDLDISSFKYFIFKEKIIPKG